MPKRLKPTKRQISFLILHAVLYTIVTVILWTTYTGGSKEWVYPWPSWITAAMSLWLVGHGCVVFTSYEDKGLKEYRRQEGKA